LCFAIGVLQALADKKKGITDEDLLALVGDEVHQAEVVWELVDLQVGGNTADNSEEGSGALLYNTMQCRPPTGTSPGLCPAHKEGCQQ
jgi:hypothetical protein